MTNSSAKSNILWTVGVIAILLIAWGLRIGSPTDVPPGLQADDERWNLEILDQVQRGEWALFFTHGWGREGLFYYLLAAWAWIWGENYVVLRLIPAFFGLLTVALTIRLGRQMWNRRVGVLAGAAVALNWWALFYSRILLRAVQLPAFFLAASCLFWSAMGGSLTGRRRWAAWVGFGLLYGLGFYTYTSARVLPFFFMAIMIAWWIRNRPAVCAQAVPALVGFTLTLLLALPLAWALLRLDSGTLRLAQVGAPLDALRQGDAAPLIEAALKTLGMFFVRGSSSWRYNLAGRPLFDPLGGALLVLGMLFSLRPQRSWPPLTALWLWLWWGIGLLPGVLSVDAPSTVRTILAMPATMFWPAMALDELWNRLQKKEKIWIPAILTVLYLALMGGLTWRDYFRRWPVHPEVRELHQFALTQAVRQAETLAATGEPVSMSVVLDADRDPYTVLHTLRPAARLPRLFDGRHALLVPTANPAALIVLENVPLASPFEALLADAALSRLDASHRTTDGRPIFRVYRGDLRQTVTDRLATAETIADFGGLLALRGVEMPRQSAQNQAVEIIAYWQAQKVSDQPWVTFVHLLNEKGEWVSGYDRLDVYPLSWQPGDLIVQLYHPWLPADLPVGEYRVAIGVYHRETMQRLACDAGPSCEHVTVGTIYVK